MTPSRKWKWLLVLGPIAAILLFSAYEGARVWWYRGFSKGARTGVIRKVSVKGPPYCKYLSGEMALQSAGLVAPEIWEFSVDDDADTNPVVVGAPRGREERRARDPRLPAGSPLAFPLHAVGVLHHQGGEVARRPQTPRQRWGLGRQAGLCAQNP